MVLIFLTQKKINIVFFEQVKYREIFLPLFKYIQSKINFSKYNLGKSRERDRFNNHSV